MIRSVWNPRARPWLVLAAATLWLAPPAWPQTAGPVSLRDVTESAGIDFRHQPSPRLEAAREILGRKLFRVAEDLPRLPGKPWGAPGVAILDVEGDGDLDLYVTNGLGAANALYLNRLVESGSLRFEDVAESAGVAARDQDSSGVCFGDLDNDGDHDLFVLGAPGRNRLFENRSRGGRVVFRDVTASAGIGGEATSTSCATGDVDGDGLLDLAVANAYDWTSSRGLLEPFVHNQPNRLWRNRGGLEFTDASAASGFLELAGLPPGAAGVSWAIAMVDVDLDGDVDVLTLDNRGSPPAEGEPQHGLLHLHRNDGRGRLRDVGLEAGFGPPSAWLGVAFADFDCDGRLDLFATNAGDYPPSFHPPGVELEVGRFASRWFLGRGDGRFADPGVGELRATVSGWGASAPDLDNDGDPDVVYHGGLYAGFFLDAGNPGAVLLNQDCRARFQLDRRALAGSRDHSRRNVQGLATGDLDRDGFTDVVTVSSFDLPADVALAKNPTVLGSPFDESAYMVLTHRPTDVPGVLATVPLELAPGTLAIELSSGNGNGWIEVTARGSAGLLPGGRANRDGIGAVVSVHTAARPHAGLRPVLGGSSYASQDALPVLFGLGDETHATVEMLWPGGVRNRLENVRAGERLIFPEIPCDFRRRVKEREAYARCVEHALDRLVAADVLDTESRERFARSAHAAPDTAAKP